MTSTPASRRARAMILAPRSWPSRPGLATRTRIGAGMLEVSRLLIHAEDAAEGIADLAERRVTLHRVEQVRHRMLGSLRRALERIEGPLHFAVIAARAQASQFFFLVLAGRFIDLQKLDGLIVRLEAVDAHDDALACLDLALVAIARGRDLGLREAGFDGGYHTAARIDLANVIVGRGLGFERELFDEVAAAQRICRVGDAALVGQHLLRAQRDGDGVLAGERVGFVERVGVERLRAAHHRGKRLDRGANHVVIRLLPGERTTGGLRVETQLQAALALRAITIAHGERPDLARGPILRDLLEEVAVGVEKEAETRRKVVDIEA